MHNPPRELRSNYVHALLVKRVYSECSPLFRSFFRYGKKLPYVVTRDVVVVVYPHLPDLWEVSAHSTKVTGSTVFCSHQDLGVMVSSFRTRRQCLSFSGRGKPSQGQRSTSSIESPDGGKGWKAFVELISS